MSAQCGLCFHRCRLAEGQTGLCRARANRGGRIVPLGYARLTSLALDPIEKKPLRRFRPGSLILSAGSFGCNLRCPFCHNPALVLPDRETDGLSTEKLLAFLETRRGKLDGVCVTGGEPTLYEDLPALLRQIRGLGFAVKLDTNGTNPDMLEALAQEGLLDYAAMDIKNSPDRYAETCGGVDLLGPVKRSAALLMAGAVDYEFRTTVCAPLHTPEEMAGIGRWLKGAKRYFLQPFVDSGELVGSGMKPLTKEEIEALRDSVLPDIPSTQIRGQ